VTAEAGALSGDLLLRAYAEGYFPMADGPAGEIGWYSPDPRAVIPLGGFHVPKTLGRRVRSGYYTVTTDRAFDAVIRACAAREDTWISTEIIDAYTSLYNAGFGHSVECWRGGELAGGLYGVALGGAFFGESMFSRFVDASKVALVHLVRILSEGGFTLLDIQFITPHLARFGAVEVPREDYLRFLGESLQKQAVFAGSGPI
jgi:leucyl/phenylalanyl-tRNA--protein transferase